MLLKLHPDAYLKPLLFDLNLFFSALPLSPKTVPCGPAGRISRVDFDTSIERHAGSRDETFSALKVSIVF